MKIRIYYHIYAYDGVIFLLKDYEWLIIACQILLKLTNPTFWVLAYPFSPISVFLHSFFSRLSDYSISPLKLQCFPISLPFLILFPLPGMLFPHFYMVKSYLTVKVHFKCYLFHDAFSKHPDWMGWFPLPLKC